VTYNVVSLDEIETVPHLGSNLIPVRYTLGFRPAGTNAWVADSGGQLVPPHEEGSGNEELYVVVRGRAKFTVGEETADAAVGTLVFVSAGEHRTAAAEEDGTIVLAVGASVGEAFEGGNWDTFAVANGKRLAGNTDEGRAILRKAIEERPDQWALVYNTACFEALAGDSDAAFDHLRRVHEAHPDQVRPYLETDSDLDPLRDDPRFQELLS
jgi:mannose-6-phosphate isomerase-like protein (cupin superfamily)